MKSQSTIKTKIKNLILAGTLLVYAPLNMLQAVNVPPGQPAPIPLPPGCFPEGCGVTGCPTAPGSGGGMPGAPGGGPGNGDEDKDAPLYARGASFGGGGIPDLSIPTDPSTVPGPIKALGAPSSGSTEDCPTDCVGSFHFSLNLGHSTIKRNMDFRGFSRQGPFEGQSGRGITRSFDQVRSLIMNTRNTHAVQMERIVVNQHSITSDLYNPNCLLFLPAPSNAKYISNNGVLQQVLTLNALTDVEALPDNEGFYIRQWVRTALPNPTSPQKDQDGKYVTPDEEPGLEIFFRNPDHGTNPPNKRLLLTYTNRLFQENPADETQVKVTSRLYDEYDTDGDSKPDILWVSTHEGSDASTPSLTTTKITYLNRGARPWDTTIKYDKYRANFDESNQIIGNGEGGILEGQYKVSTIIKVFEDHSLSEEGGDHNGKRLVSITSGEGNGLSTVYEYYNKNLNPLLSTNEHGRLKSVRRADGTWERWEYVEDDITNVIEETKYSSWLDVSFEDIEYKQAKVEITTIGQEDQVYFYERVEKIGGINGTKIYHLRTEVKEDTETGYLLRTIKLNDGENWHSHITAFHPYSNAHHASRPAYIIHFDGSLVTYSYTNPKNETWDGQTIRTSTITIEKGFDRIDDGIKSVTTGTRYVSTFDSRYNLLKVVTKDISTNLTLKQKRGTDLNNQGIPTKWIYDENENLYSITQYGPDGTTYTKSKSGIMKTYHYDPLGNVNQIDHQASSDAIVLETKISRLNNVTTTTVKAGTKVRFASQTKVHHGEPISCCGSPEVSSKVTRLTPDSDGKIRPGADPLDDYAFHEESITEVVHSTQTKKTKVQTSPDGQQTTTTYYKDGRIFSITGNTVTDIEITYGVDNGLLLKHNVDQENANEGDSHYNGSYSWKKVEKVNGTEWKKVYYDQLSRIIRTEFADGSFSYNVYHDNNSMPGSRGRLFQSINPDGVVSSYYHSFEDLDFNVDDASNIRSFSKIVQPIPKDTIDRNITTVTINDIISNSEGEVQSRTRVYVNQLEVQQVIESIDGLHQESKYLGETSTREQTHPINGSWTWLRTSDNGPSRKSYFQKGQLVAVLEFNPNAEIPESFSGFTDSVSGDPIIYEGMVKGTERVYDDFGTLLQLIDARKGSVTYENHLPNGRPQTVTDTAGNTTTYEYDVLGRTIISDHPNTNNNTFENITKFSYSYWEDPATEIVYQIRTVQGDLVNPKLELYDDSNRLIELRTYKEIDANEAITINTTNADITKWVYNDRGQLSDKIYSDGKGPHYTYTKTGQLETRTWARGPVTTYEYENNHLVNIKYDDNGVTPDIHITYNDYGFPEETIQGTGDDKNTWKNIYHSDTRWLDYQEISYNDGEITRTIDYKSDANFHPKVRPGGYTLKQNATVLNSLTYTYDDFSRIHEIETENGDKFTYDYLTNSHHIQSITSPVHTTYNEYEPDSDHLDYRTNTITSTQQESKHDYVVNTIGQRTSVTQTGNEFGDFTGTITYRYDKQGQVIEADHSIKNSLDRALDYDKMGNRKNTVNGLLDDLPALNTHTLNDKGLNQYHIADNKTIEYDDDGNRTKYGDITYVWNSENRLIEIKSNNQTLATYEYDPFGRRISKNTSSETHFIYDNWNMIEEIHSTTLSKYHNWGLDIASSHHAAGGVSALLSTSIGGQSYYPTYDGNGNILSYVKVDGDFYSKLGYDLFGSSIPELPNESSMLPHAFSTKYQDPESNLYYYGLRYYDPAFGTWLNRDPINEQGGINLYSFVGNNPINNWDYVGLRYPIFDDPPEEVGILPFLRRLKPCKKPYAEINSYGEIKNADFPQREECNEKFLLAGIIYGTPYCLRFKATFENYSITCKRQKRLPCGKCEDQESGPHDNLPAHAVSFQLGGFSDPPVIDIPGFIGIPVPYWMDQYDNTKRDMYLKEHFKEEMDALCELYYSDK